MLRCDAWLESGRRRERALPLTFPEAMGACLVSNFALASCTPRCPRRAPFSHSSSLGTLAARGPPYSPLMPLAEGRAQEPKHSVFWLTQCVFGRRWELAPSPPPSPHTRPFTTARPLGRSANEVSERRGEARGEGVRLMERGAGGGRGEARGWSAGRAQTFSRRASGALHACATGTRRAGDWHT